MRDAAILLVAEPLAGGAEIDVAGVPIEKTPGRIVANLPPGRSTVEELPGTPTPHSPYGVVLEDID